MIQIADEEEFIVQSTSNVQAMGNKPIAIRVVVIENPNVMTT